MNRLHCLANTTRVSWKPMAVDAGVMVQSCALLKMRRMDRCAGLGLVGRESSLLSDWPEGSGSNIKTIRARTIPPPCRVECQMSLFSKKKKKNVEKQISYFGCEEFRLGLALSCPPPPPQKPPSLSAGTDLNGKKHWIFMLALDLRACLMIRDASRFATGGFNLSCCFDRFQRFET